MDHTQRQQLQHAIEQAIVSTQEDIASLKEKTQPIAPDDAIGRLSRMEAINEKAMLEANCRSAEQRLLALKRAQHRVEEDTFGYCKTCGEAIPIPRILLMPETQFCVHCAE